MANSRYDVPKTMQKPKPEDFGWHERRGFDDEPSGWMLENGEKEYIKAVKEYEQSLKNVQKNYQGI